MAILRTDRAIAVFAAICVLVGSVAAEEWYIPKRTEVLKRGSFELGARVQYTPDEIVGLNSRSVEIIPSMRLSPINRLELYVEGSFLRRDAEQFINAQIQHFSDEGPGDVFAQLSFDAISREDWKVILGVDGTIPTGQDPFENRVGLGSGFYRVAPGVTYMKVLDPVILFGYLGYQFSFEETFQGVGTVKPGDDFRLRLGASFLLNPRVRASVYTTANIFGHTVVNGRRSAGSDGDIGRLGGSIGWAMTDKWSLDANTAFGITESSSDQVISLGLTRKIW